MRQQV
jgi:hypothetical protein